MKHFPVILYLMIEAKAFDYGRERGREMAQMNSLEKNLDLGLTNMKRNPYLVDYAEYKKTGEVRAPRGMSEAVKPMHGRRSANHKPTSSHRTPARTAPSGRTAARTAPAGRPASVRPMPAGRAVAVKPVSGYCGTAKDRRRAALEKKRRMLFYRRMALTVAAVMTVVLAAVFVVRIWQKADAASEAEVGTVNEQQNKLFFDDLAGKKVQGLDAGIFGRHPTWTEDFLTPNEYSRPGDELKEVNSIFVHYTANPGTSAAQNRSYFEQLKDTHERSASAHFIIGYDGEILQCIPLNEIAYAVQTRNEDSISIECCYLEKDGAFTQETYDSLIGLLRWLKEAYGLDSEDILRHYDCGGKKCPLYYTEHEDAWEQLKKDV